MQAPKDEAKSSEELDPDENVKTRTASEYEGVQTECKRQGQF